MLTLLPDTDPLLHRICDPVNEDELPGRYLDITDEMFSLMHRSNGIGLAAPQVGISERFFIMQYGGRRYTCINPDILAGYGECEIAQEGCLSYPGEYLNVLRIKQIKVTYLNSNGHRKTHKLTGILSRVFQHEFDHLNGIVFRERFTK